MGIASLYLVILLSVYFMPPSYLEHIVTHVPLVSRGERFCYSATRARSSYALPSYTWSAPLAKVDMVDKYVRDCNESAFKDSDVKRVNQ